MAATPEAQALLERWRTETDFTARDELLEQLVENNIFPGKDEEEYELSAGLYPGLDDPEFLPKLMRKREFQESKQTSVRDSMIEGVDKCRSSEDFEITPVQKFISRFLSPRTPYRSALLYHGVGVGKTCAAITVSESYLREFPGRKVYIVAPPNIQEGFRRTIFDREGLKIVKGGMNHHRGCTGDVYLDLTGSFTEPNKSVIETRVAKAIKSRYEFFGYTSFYNYILQILSALPKGASPDKLEQMKFAQLRNEFSNRLIIIDEAHNLRDNPMETEDDTADDATPADSSDAKAGKKLTPFLKEVLSTAEGASLILMTATPMYNSFTEIIFLLNLLLLNEKFERLRVEDVFDVRRQIFVPGGREALGKVASKFISFMRGENPLTFPIRLEPVAPTRVMRWPSKSPKGEPIDSQERANCIRLQCVSGSFTSESEELYKKESLSIVTSSEGLGITNMDILIQAGNFLFPGEENEFLDRIRQQGFENTFSKEKRGSTVQFRNVDEEVGASWLHESKLPASSGKCAVLLNRLNGCRGVAFVYSRFVASGALTIAMVLEANGYTCWNREMGFLAEGNQGRDGRKCALCPRYERGHGTVPKEGGTAEHSFKPARYVLLTGSEELSPNNAKSIDAARAATNVYGEDVKVIIGSQIAGEGLDLRYIREVFVFDSWYHLNKLEQIIGRGIRNCSHAALPLEKRNCTITLLVNSYADGETETIDMYSYRQALRKAITMGNVTRVLKEYAMDCSLNKEAILVNNLDPVARLYDSQGLDRKNVSINDVPLTPMCDWLQTCEYDCKYGDNKAMNMEISMEMQDTSTYNEYTAQSQLNKIRMYLQDRISRGTPFVTFERIENDFPIIPRPLLASLLNDIVEKRELKINTEHGSGYIIFKNGYYIFQPDQIEDTRIPIALRVVNIPVPRDRFVPKEEEVAREEEVDLVATVGEEVSKKISSIEEDSEALWNEAVEWCKEIREGTADFEVSPQVMEEVRKLPESGGLEKAQKERLDVISLMYKMIREDEATRKIFSEIVLEYIWDEFITTGTKRELLNLGWDKPDMQSVAKDSFWEFEGNLYIRLLNGGNNMIEYICVDAAAGRTAPCPRSIVEVLEREKDQDPLLKHPIDVRYTGNEYGFINFNPRKKKLVFKKNVPPFVGKKVTRGSECAINSGTAFEIMQLEKHGRVLKEKGHNNFGLDNYGIHYRNIKNSIRICTISDLVLRYMNRLKIHGKRWFYRALESKLHNHPLR
jgi:hypothetical protein